MFLNEFGKPLCLSVTGSTRKTAKTFHFVRNFTIRKKLGRQAFNIRKAYRLKVWRAELKRADDHGGLIRL
jgi:hypothetical protein